MKEREIFAGALERTAGAERDGYLAEACAGDDALRASVERLLVEHARAEPSILDQPVGPRVSQAGDGTSLTEKAGDRIDRYHLLQIIGEGGFGTVWMAEQKEPVRRKVALKVIKAGMDTKQVVARFEAERQALALMDHPNIASVLDGGATEAGRPFFVMELVKGVPITDYCDEARLSTVDRLRLFQDVCYAVQHAHQKGIIHRDLKPSNVMVTQHGGRPVPKVIDFGIAKATHSDLTQRTLFTEFHQFIGTPEYMAPEQTQRSAVDVDTRADVYSLGALLYELLTGTKPFDLSAALGHGWDEMLRVIREQEPARPSTRVSTMGEAGTQVADARHATTRSLGKLFKDDLDWIVLKALEKDRERRYASSSGMAADIERFLSSEPVEASPPSRAYRLRKLVRRYRKTVAVGALVAAALVVGIVGATSGMLRARSAERVAAHERDLATRNAAIAEATVDFLTEDLLASVDPASSRGREVTVREVLDNAARSVGRSLVDEPELEAAVRDTLGRTYSSLGDYRESAEHLRRIVELDAELSRDIGDGADPAAQTLRARARLASIARIEGRLDEARGQIDDVVEQQARLFGPEHSDTLRSRVIAARVRSDLADYATAEAQLVSIIAALDATLGPEHRDTWSARRALVAVLRRQDRQEEAESVARELLRLTRERLGRDHPDTLRAMGEVGRLLWARKRYEDANTVFSEQLAIAGRVFGDEHPQTMKAVGSVAMVLMNMNRYQEAERILRELRDLQALHLGPETPATLTTIHNLAVALERQARYEEALGVYEALRDTHERQKGPRHPKTLLAASNCGVTLKNLGRLEDAEAILRDVLRARREVFGDDHQRTMQSVGHLLDVLRLQPERFEEARELQVEHLAHLERVAASPEAGLWALDLLAWEFVIAIPEDLRDPVRAQGLIEDVIARSEERVPNYLDTLAEALFLQGKYAQAIEVEREAIQLAPQPSRLAEEFSKRLEKYEAAAAKDE